MPDLKIDFTKLGPIRLMPLDTSSLFLPFGRPIADYVRGAVANQNGTRTLLKQSAIEFSPAVRWTESTRVLLTTGFGDLEREGIPESAFVNTPADPGVPGFLSFTKLVEAVEGPNQANISSAVVRDLAIAKPRVGALPLRQKMTFGPAPAAKVKPAATPAPAPVSAPKAAATPVAPKPAPTPAAPAKPTPVVAPKPAAPVTPVKVVTSPTPAKPVTVIPPAPRPAAVASAGPKPVAVPPVQKINTPAAPAAQVKQAPVQAASPRVPIAPAARAPEGATSTIDTPGAKPAPAPPAAKAPAPAPVRPAVTASPSLKPPTPPMPSGRASSAPTQVEAVPLREVVSREAPKEREPVAAPKPEPPAPRAPAFAESSTRDIAEPHLGMDTEGESFLSRIPKPVLALVAVLFLVGMYFVFFGGKGSTATPKGVSVGEDGWAPYEWVSDAAGSRRGRQIQIYRPSVGMADYQIQFIGQIQSKALGWVFREFDTKNYYGMKIETVRPGAMALTHFAVVDGRESSNSQRPLSIDARPGASYRIKLDVSGPRFTVYIGGEPVDFWTDNRLKTGGFGVMTERDEVGAISSIQFSYPKNQ